MRSLAFISAALAAAAVLGEDGLFPPGVKTVGIVSVSSVMSEAALEAGTNFLVRCGYNVKVMDNVREACVAPADVRARLFEAAYLSPDIDLVLFARGGEGAADVVERIDWARLRAVDKPVVGFSDVTLILNAMLAKGVGHPFSGPMLSSMERWNDASRAAFAAAMNLGPLEPVALRALKPGEARGRAMGGHITRMHWLFTRGLAPSTRGRVVFFECTARHSFETLRSDLDEMRAGGFFADAAAVVFCDFRHRGEERRRLMAYLDGFAASLSCPVYADYPYGHCADSRLLDFRREVQIGQDGVLSWRAPLEMRSIAHRGMWSRDVPQNTLEAISRAYDSGATWVETDFHHTKAGQMVCIHAEGELLSYTGCSKKIADLTPDDVQTLNLGARDGLERPYRIPLLADVLAVVPPHGVLQAEIKGYSPQYAGIFDSAVKAAGLAPSNIVVSSFQYGALKDFKARCPQYRTVWLTSLKKGEAFDVAAVAARCAEAGIGTYCPGIGTIRGAITRADVEALRDAGIEFRVWGVNSPTALAEAARIGATGFTTNHWLDSFGWAASLPGVELER